MANFVPDHPAHVTAHLDAPGIHTAKSLVGGSEAAPALVGASVLAATLPGHETGSALAALDPAREYIAVRMACTIFSVLIPVDTLILYNVP